MKKLYKCLYLLASVTVLALAQSCRQSEENPSALKYATQHKENHEDSTDINSVQASIHPLQEHTKFRQPDKRVKAIKGHALLMETDGLRLTAIDTAVIQSETYSVTSLYDNELPPVPEGMMNMTKCAVGYRLLPGGEHFRPYAELRVKYDPSRLPFGYTADDIYTSYYDTVSRAWVRLKRVSIDTVEHEIVSLTSHFTDFINEILKAPEMPETQAFVPTQISGLEAANPLARYTTIAPPEANNMGTANLSYPFYVPAGRAGMQPNIALTYNSSGGNGVCGMGWDMSVPCISVETRWGVPLYEDHNETETYLYNGEQLLVSHESVPTFSDSPVPRNHNEYTKRFYPRVEGAFDSIVRHGTTPQTYWWEVFDRQGTCYIYGLGDGELKAYGSHAIAKWYLTRVIDRHGNTTRYQYKKYENASNGVKSGTALYLDKIVYTATNEGFVPQPWYGYCVQFYYGFREDPVISGNYGLKENICKRLDTVKTWFVKIKPVRKEDGINLEMYMPGRAAELKNHAESFDDPDGIAARILNIDSYILSDSSLIRGYRLLYDYSQTGKSLLSAVVEMNAQEWMSHPQNINAEELDDGTALKYHQFHYRGIDRPTFGEERVLNTNVYMASSGLDEYYPSPLGGSREWKSGFSLSGALGQGADTWLRTMNLEVTGSVSPKSTSHGTTTIVDLNGDGHPDLLYRISKNNWECQLYHPDTTNPSGVGSFGNPIQANLPTDEFSSTITKDNYSVGLGAHAGVEYYDYNAGLNIGGQKSYSKCDVTTYFADVNSDGKADIVKDGRVWFNNTHGDSVCFSTTLQTHRASSVVCDTGYYSLSGSVPLNDSIFDDGHISYTTVIGGREELMPYIIEDTLVERRTDTTYRSAVRAWIAQYDGNIHISGMARLDTNFIEAISRTKADGVHISIQCNGNIISGTGQDLKLDTPSHTFSVDTTVQKGDRIYFRVEALKSDLYDVVEWNPVIYYTDRDTAELDGANRKAYLFSAKNDFLAWQGDRFYMPLDGTVKINSDYSLSRQQADNVHLHIQHLTGDGSFIEEDTQTIFAGDTVSPEDGEWELDWVLDSSDVLTFEVYSGSELDWTALRWTPHVISESFADTTIPVFVVMNNEREEKDTIYTIDIYPSPSYHPNDEFTGWNNTLDTILGVFRSHYRGWGAFTYNSDTVRMPMDESIIRLDERIGDFGELNGDEDVFAEELASSLGDTSQTVSSTSIQSGLASFVPNSENSGTSLMNATYDINSRSRIWTAVGYKSFITPTLIGLYNWQTVCAAQGDTDLLVPVTNHSVAASSSGGGMAVGPVKGSGQEGYSVHASISAGIQDAESNLGINGCVNYSHGDSWVTADFVDMNGDGYPDIVGQNDVQYTNSRGGLSNKRAGTAVSGENGIQNTVYDAISLQGGSSFASYEKHGKARGRVHIEQRSKGAGLSQSKTLAMSFDKQSLSWIDLNGDGLPDCVNGNEVYLNLGYSYFGGIPMSGILKTENTSTTSSTSGALDYSTGTNSVNTLTNTTVSGINKSFSGGKTVSRSDSDSPVLYIDINGDGLADKLIGDTMVYFNNGWGFAANGYRLSSPAPSHSGGYNVDYNGNVTVGVPFTILLLNLKFQGTVGGNIGNSISTTESVLMDMNADGLPDVVRRYGASNIAVRYNQLYDVDKLVSVESFYGNRIELTYAQANYSSRSRQRPIVMSSMKVEDLSGASEDSRYYTYNYVGHVYSTTERTAYGFDSVVITQYLDGHPYRITHQKYRTDLYKMRGRKTSELLTDASYRPYVKQVWNYELKQISDGTVVPPEVADCFGATWPALDSAFTLHYNPFTGQVKVRTAERYIHKDSGRVAEYVNLGDVVTTSDDVHCAVEYTRSQRNQYALPKMMTFTDANNNKLRRRVAKYNYEGLLSELIVYNDGEDTSSVFNYSFDEYGNPHSAEMPPNDSSQREKYIYTYDTMMHQFLVCATDSAFVIASRAEYDVRLGVPIREYSVGGDSISYSYDDWGRPLTIRAPQEGDTTGFPTIQYKYWDGAQPALQPCQTGFHSFTAFPAVTGKISEPTCNHYHGGPIWAQTLHHSQRDTSLDVTTVIFADGHGRVIQTRKTAVVEGQDTLVASGRIIYDDAGRPVRQYEPVELPDAPLCEYVQAEDEGLYTITEYDPLDRVVRKEIPAENIVTTNVYGFVSTGGSTLFSLTATDPENNTSTVLTDARGLTMQSIDAIQGVTRFEYDALGQMLHSYDPENFVTTYSYDMQGRVTSRVHPDAGATSYEYDAAGHLTKEINSLGVISYRYTYSRLQRKCYHNLPENNVTYHYTGSGRGAGQPDTVRDGSGVQTFEYDEMGRVSKSVRTLSVPTSGYAYTFTHTYEYDSWNRMLSLTYPDGERVHYTYNRAGDLLKMTGDKNGNQRMYINGIEYDKYGKRTKIIYGNNSHTEYTYDQLQRLVLLHSEDNLNNVMQHNEYTFDKVGNITLLQNTANDIAGLGGEYTNHYTYDPLYRLVSAGGGGVAGGQPRDFSIEEMQYSASGRQGRKLVSWNSVSSHGMQHMEYGYANTGDKPHAPRSIVNNATGGLYDLTWDDAGNLIRLSIQDEPEADYTTRYLHWTEDNRLHTVADVRHYSYYAYDYSGERTLKMTGDASEVDQNALEQHIFSSLGSVTLYPSPYIVVSDHGYTKHYYAGTERVAARIGSGGLSHDTPCISQDDGVTRRTDSLFWHNWELVDRYEYERAENMDIVRIDGTVLEDADRFNREKIPVRLHSELKVEPWKLQRIIEVYSEPVFQPALPPDPQPDPGEPSEEQDVFFYHSDHLGSASWITDGDGNPVQHLQYLPFGQPLVDQHPAGYQERFTFTGKEKDEETGYGYFSARYMDHELLTMWLSVDPMADKYPSTSPYAYCVWNPVKLVDPDGMDTIFSFACETPNKKQNEKNNRLLTSLRNIGDSPYCIAVGMHGDKKTQKVEMSNTIAGTSTTLVTAEEFAKRIKSGSFGSFLYVNNQSKNKLTIFVLYSCYTGYGDNSFGEQLSELLESSIVIAPEGAVWAGIHKGKTTISNREAIPVGNEEYKKGSRCVWNVFYKGKKVLSFSHGAPQAWINKQGGTSGLIKKITQSDENK